MRIATLLTLLLALAVPDTAFSQVTGSIAGMVRSETDRPLAGVAITVSGARQATLTGQDGRFLLRGVGVGEHEIRAEIIGYATGRMTVTVVGGEVAEANFRLDPQAIEMDRVVVTGYGTQTRRELSGAVASIDGDELAIPATPTVTVSTALQGHVAGVAVVTNSGIPGAGASVRVRGRTPSGRTRSRCT